MTQGRLGEAFGITDKAVSSWERGETIPEFDKVAKLARLLQVPSMWLLEGKGPPPPPNALESLVEQLDPDGRQMLEAMAQTILRQRGSAA